LTTKRHLKMRMAQAEILFCTLISFKSKKRFMRKNSLR
jgi:hypothetical protein